MSDDGRLEIAAWLGLIAAHCPDGISILRPRDCREPERINRRERIASNYARRACEGLGGIPERMERK